MEEKEVCINITGRDACAAAYAIEDMASSFFNVFEQDALRLAANKDNCGSDWFLSYYKKLDSAICSIHALANIVISYLEAHESGNC